MAAGSTVGQRITPPNSQWVEDLPLREAPLSGKADGWDELNHLDANYLELSMAADVPRGVMALAGFFGLLGIGYMVSVVAPGFLRYSDLFDLMFLIAPIIVLLPSIFVLRLDLSLPKDRPIRFNRAQRKVYVNSYTWTHNPFGRWGGGVKVFDWDTLQARITKQVSASGEVITQRYALELVSCKPGTFEVVDSFVLQSGAQTTGQFEDIWALLRHYMAQGLKDLPPQNLRDQNPGFVDCLLFAMPWFAPTAKGRRTRERMQGFLAKAFMVVMSLAAPIFLVFGVGNFIVMKLAPDSSWPDGVDEKSRSAEL